MSKITINGQRTIKIAYIGGGSMSWARTFIGDLALDNQLNGEVRLYDIDFEAAKRNEIIGNLISQNTDTPGKWDYRTVLTLQEALAGADFVIISVLPGNIELMQSDLHLPERLGIYQSVGDTTGPGGIIRALRAVPMFVEFAEQIKEYSPDAWVINYTNPMSICMRALYHTYPQIKAIGCCHEVSGTAELLASMIRRETDKPVKRSDIMLNILGINHFTWINKASYNEYNLFPLFADYAEKYYDSGYDSECDENTDEVFRCKNRVKFDLFQKYGLIAAAGDRHLAEFLPGEIYLQNKKKAERWGYSLTSADWRITDREEKLKLTLRIIEENKSPDIKPSGEEGVLIMKALCGLTRIVTNINLPNNYLQINNLPKETVVETNVLISRDDVRPIFAGALPATLYTLFGPHIDNQDEVLRAALCCDREAVLRAFERDPLVRGRCSAHKQYKLVDEMIKNTLSALPSEWSEY